MFSKLFVRFNRADGNRYDFSARRLIVGPAVSNAAHMLRTNRCFIPGIEDQRDDFAELIGQTPGLTIRIA